MFAMPSFFALIVQPSENRNISCAISSGDMSAYPASRVLMNHAFSAKRQASMKNGMPCARQIADAPRMFSMLTGWPPSELLVTVIITSGTLPTFSCSTRSSAARSIFPLNG